MIEKGSNKYEGLIPDMLEKLSDKLDFDYELVKVADGKYGQKASNGDWNGMIGEVVDRVSNKLFFLFTLYCHRYWFLSH